MDVKAEDTWRVESYTLPSDFDNFETDCDPNLNGTSYDVFFDSFEEWKPSGTKWGIIMCMGTDPTGSAVVIYLYNSENPFTTPKGEAEKLVYAGIHNAGELITFKTRYSNYPYYILRKNITPSSSEGTSSGEATSPTSSSSTPHTHSYSWVTVQEANVGQDGIEEYRCSCGDVQGRSIIPASEVFVKGLYGEIKNAPQNGTATFDSGRLYTISDYVIKKLAERTDVTTVITFEYQNQAYKLTIPAGADFTGLLADEDYFYGYFFFANAVGATIEAI